MGEGFGTFNIFGKTWTKKSFLRFLVCIILINFVVALVYFFRTSAFSGAYNQDVPIGETEKHQSVANLMSHDVNADSTETDTIVIDSPNDMGQRVTDVKQQDYNRSPGVDIRADVGIDKEPRVDSHAAEYHEQNPFSEKSQMNEYDYVQQQSRDNMISIGRAGVHNKHSKMPQLPQARAVNPRLPSDTISKYTDAIDIDANNDSEFSSSTHDESEGIDAIFSSLSKNRRNYTGPTYNLEDPDHPQYSNAFPRHTKPLHLLNWTRSSDSRLHFQPIDDQEVWLYSAFYDDREEVVLVKVFGMGHRDSTGRVYCHFIGFRGERLDLQKGRLRLMKDTHGSHFAAMEVLCPTRANLQPAFMRVTFTKNSSLPTNEIRVHYRGDQIRNFTVCFPPLHSNYNESAQIVQIIEFNRVLGADHFFIYNFSMSAEVGMILQQYQSDGLVSILPWPLPTMDTWYYGQILAINDCMYRNMGTSRFVVVTDTDEVIVPHIHLSWATLLESIRKHPWQRDDDFIDDDLKPGGENYRLGIVEDEALEGDLQKKGKKRKRVFKDEQNFLHNAISGKYSQAFKSDHSIRDNSQRNKKFERNIDTFPSRSLKTLFSRNLLAYESHTDDAELSDTDHFQFGSFSFRCAFYNVKPLRQEQWKKLQSYPFSKQEKDLFVYLPRCPMINLIRTDTVHEHGLRSKIILQPERVVSCGIHKVVLHVEGYRTAYVEPEIAILHHYREYKISSSNTLDTSALVFKDTFYHNLKLAMKKFSAILLS